MEGEEPSSVASTMKRNIGGGEKRKRKEQEGEPGCTQIVSSSCLGTLESIECVLKCLNSALRFQGPWENVRLEEQRIAGLIYSHVCSYIILYHLEKNRTHDNSSRRIKEIDILADDGEVVTDGGYVDELLWDVQRLDGTFTGPLIDGRRSLVGVPTLRHQSVNRGTGEVPIMFNTLMVHNRVIREQELTRVLHTLEVIGHARSYAPPGDDKEFLFYRRIRKQIASFLLHAQTRDQFLDDIGGEPRKPPLLPDPLVSHEMPDALCFIPPTLQLVVSVEQMPEHLALLQECNRGVTRLLSSRDTPTPTHATISDLLDITLAKAESCIALLSWTPKQDSSATTRSDWLDRVIAILGRIEPFGEGTPTEAEARLYALIGEHVRSSIWLSNSRAYGLKNENWSCGVYCSNVSTDRDHRSSSNKSDAHGNHACTREQLLGQIVACLRAIKSSCMAGVPSLEEEKKYRDIWWSLCPGLLACMRSRPPPHEDEGAGEISELELKLSFIYKRVISFLALLREEILSAAAAVHQALLPEQSLSPQDALDWFMKCEDAAATKAKEFVDRSLSDGTVAHLDHALLMLVELQNTGLYFFRLSNAVNSVDWAWAEVKNGEDHAMLASELQNAIASRELFMRFE